MHKLMQTVEPHKIILFNKSYEINPRTVFRVETTRKHNQTYEQVFFSADPVKAISYFNNTSMPKGGRVRVLIDGDLFKVLSRKDF